MKRSGNQPLEAGTDRSGAITTGGTAQQLAPLNLGRKGLLIQNISAGNLGVNLIGGTAAIGTAGTFTIIAGGFLEVTTNRAISIIGATTGQAFTAVEV